jgi:hypothetical protein
MRDDIDILLSRGGLSGAERERVLDAVLDRLDPARPRLRRAAVIAVTVVALAAGVVAYLANSRPRHSAFASRGRDRSAAQIEMVCLPGSLGACPRGSRLLFRPWGLGQERSRYLSAYAEPEGRGERIWYFSADEESPKMGSSPTSAEPIDRVVVLGQEHAVGEYAVHIVVSDHPLPRADVLHPPPDAVVFSETVRLHVIP